MSGLKERLLAKVSPEPMTGCWLWLGSLAHGYGQIRGGREREHRVLLAHRVSFEMFVGPIPEGLTIDHRCQQPACVNPAHLEPVTGLENTQRWARSQTHCKRGHPLRGSNLVASARGRRCKACQKRSQKAWNERRRARERREEPVRPPTAFVVSVPRDFPWAKHRPGASDQWVEWLVKAPESKGGA